jgi:hypothetical protein
MTTNLENPIISSKSGDTSSELRIVNGKMLLGKKNGDAVEWKTGISADGISAGLITAGEIDTRKISIKNGKDPTFKWDANGITAYDNSYYGGLNNSIDITKFIRLDKHGLYGINGTKNGDIWVPENVQEVDKEASFSLTWDGLKVTGNEGVIARLGKANSGILEISKTYTSTENGELVTEKLMRLTNDGKLSIGNFFLDKGALYSVTSGKELRELYLGLQSAMTL